MTFARCAQTAPRPQVVLTAPDHQRLLAAALNGLLQAPRLAAGLLDEVDRACVVAEHALPPDVARLGSWVQFREGPCGPVRRAQLALQPTGPQQLSVLSSIGAALIGLRAGETIRWSDRLGSTDDITLLRVEPGARPEPRSGAGAVQDGPCR